MWVLIIIMGVQGGAHVTPQEFTSKQNCESAKAIVLELKGWGSYGKAECTPK